MLNSAILFRWQPDPLIEALESVVGDNPLDGRLEAAQADAEVLSFLLVLCL